LLRRCEANKPLVVKWQKTGGVVGRYRLYIDEVGNADLGSSADPNHRYLSLTGIAIEQGYVATTVYPAVEALKTRFFNSHPDEPLILHRSQLVNKNYPFQALRDPKIEQAFNAELLRLLARLRLRPTRHDAKT